jgi:hypothetical protein
MIFFIARFSILFLYQRIIFCAFDDSSVVEYPKIHYSWIGQHFTFFAWQRDSEFCTREACSPFWPSEKKPLGSNVSNRAASPKLCRDVALTRWWAAGVSSANDRIKFAGVKGAYRFRAHVACAGQFRQSVQGFAFVVRLQDEHSVASTHSPIETFDF